MDRNTSPMVEQIQKLDAKLSEYMRQARDTLHNYYLRIKVIENFIGQNYPEDLNLIHKRIEDTHSRVKDIEYRLEHIVSLPTELDIRLRDVERRLSKNSGFTFPNCKGLGIITKGIFTE